MLGKVLNPIKASRIRKSLRGDEALSLYITQEWGPKSKEDFDKKLPHYRTLLHSVLGTKDSALFGDVGRINRYSADFGKNVTVSEIATRIGSRAIKNNLINFQLGLNKEQEPIRKMYLVLVPKFTDFEVISPLVKNAPSLETMRIINSWLIYFNLGLSSIKVVENDLFQGKSFLVVEATTNKRFYMNDIIAAFNSELKKE